MSQHLRFVWIESETELRLILDAPLDPSKLKVYEAQKVLKFSILSHEPNRIRLKLDEKLDFSKNYEVSYHHEKIFAYFSLQVLNNFFYSDEKLGSFFIDKKVSVKIWSPPALTVEVCVYAQDAKTLLGKKELARKKNGIWEEVLSPEEFGIKT